MCFLLLSPNASKLKNKKKQKKTEYRSTTKILDRNNIEPPNFEIHDYIQIINSLHIFASF